MATHIEWKGSSKQLLVNCADCKAPLLRVAPGPLGARAMRCFGATVVGSDRFPAVAHVVCDACQVVTTVPRRLVAGIRIPQPLYASLSGGDAARIVMGCAGDRPVPSMRAGLDRQLFEGVSP